jgi:hypothetical protein
LTVFLKLTRSTFGSADTKGARLVGKRKTSFVITATNARRRFKGLGQLKLKRAIFHDSAHKKSDKEINEIYWKEL